MTVVKRALSGHPPSRLLLAGLLAVAAFVHLARIGSLPCAADDASCAGLGIVYLVLLAWCCSVSDGGISQRRSSR